MIAEVPRGQLPRATKRHCTDQAQSLAPGVQQVEMIMESVEVLQRSARLIRNVRKLQKLNEDFRQMHEVDVGAILHAVQRECGSQ